jgi:FKBP-type peptidyl-prolyl cis-trans isomerase FkpA
MKQILFTLLLLSVIGLASCKKFGTEPNIKQYDQQQIQSYITANGLTGMQRDLTNGDTTGIYYNLITPGTGATVDYPDEVSFVYTLRSFDGKFIASDTVLNHFDGFLGYVGPSGLQLGIHNLLKNKGGKIRLLIPSRLAYGVNGKGSGSTTITSGRIAGNQCLDYTVNLIDNQAVYDDLVIRNYLTAKNLTGYSKTADGVYYKVTTPGTGTNPITYNSTITGTYAGWLMNGTVFDDHSSTTTSFNIADMNVAGLVEALEHYAIVGTSISVIIPSGLAYGTTGSSSIIPANACLRFDYTIQTVTP